MNKSQLQDGFKVQLVNGNELYVCGEHLLSDRHALHLAMYKDNLAHPNYHYSILKVFNHAGEEVFTAPPSKKVLITVAVEVPLLSYILPDETEDEFFKRAADIYLHTPDGDKIDLGGRYTIEEIGHE